MGFVWQTARRDLRRRLSDPTALAIWFGIPILLGGLMTLAMGGHEARSPQAHVLLADEDETFLSRMVAGSFGGQSDTGSLARVERVTRAEGQLRMAGGEATALLIIPAGFSKALIDDSPIALELVTNPAQSILPGIVEEVLSVVIDGSFYAQRLIGDPARRLLGPRPSEAGLDQASIGPLVVEVSRLWQRLKGTLDPPAIRLTMKAEAKDEGASRPNFGLIFLPGLLFMSLLFVAQGIAEDLWVEHDSGTLRRVLVAPRRASAFLMGKLVAGLAVVGAILLVGLSLAALVYGIAWPSALGAWAWGLLSGFFFLLVLYVAYLFASSRRIASVLASMVIFPMMMLGGAYFPFEVMPAWMAAVGRLTPNGWALVQFRAILAGSPDAHHLAITTLALGLGCLALFLVALRRIRGRFALG